MLPALGYLAVSEVKPDGLLIDPAFEGERPQLKSKTEIAEQGYEHFDHIKATNANKKCVADCVVENLCE